MQRGENNLQKLYVFVLLLSFGATMLGIGALQYKHQQSSPTVASPNSNSTFQKLGMIMDLNR